MEDNNCARCRLEVTRRQEALFCDGLCGRWQHRRCGTGIDRQTYRLALRSDVEISWKCTECTDLETADAYLVQHPEVGHSVVEEFVPNADEQDVQEQGEMPSFIIPFDVDEPSLLDDSMTLEESEIEMRGCAFRWTQAVWRKLQELGLQTFFNNDATANRYFRQVLALPYLPAELITCVLRELREEAASEAQRSLLDYVARTWVDSTLWPPSTWSGFYCSIRTNNDVEGWHWRLNARASRGDLNMYLLMSLLAQESNIAEIEMQLLRESQVTRRQRSAKNTKTLFAAWDRLIAKERNGRQTLKSVCRVAPMPIEA